MSPPINAYNSSGITVGRNGIHQCGTGESRSAQCYQPLPGISLADPVRDSSVTGAQRVIMRADGQAHVVTDPNYTLQAGERNPTNEELERVQFFFSSRLSAPSLAAALVPNWTQAIQGTQQQATSGAHALSVDEFNTVVGIVVGALALPDTPDPQSGISRRQAQITRRIAGLNLGDNKTRRAGSAVNDIQRIAIERLGQALGGETTPLTGAALSTAVYTHLSTGANGGFRIVLGRPESGSAGRPAYVVFSDSRGDSVCSSSGIGASLPLGVNLRQDQVLTLLELGGIETGEYCMSGQRSGVVRLLSSFAANGGATRVSNIIETLTGVSRDSLRADHTIVATDITRTGEYNPYFTNAETLQIVNGLQAFIRPQLERDDAMRTSDLRANAQEERGGRLEWLTWVNTFGMTAMIMIFGHQAGLHKKAKKLWNRLHGRMPLDTVEQVSTNRLTRNARNGEYRPNADPQSRELAELIEGRLFKRSGSRSAYVEAPKGWGKQPLMQELARRALSERPKAVFFQLTTDSIMGGTRFRGDLEERLTDIPREIRAAHERGLHVILVIDEFHETTVGGRNHEDTRTLLERFKGPLAEGTMTILGFSTPDEMREARWVAGLEEVSSEDERRIQEAGTRRNTNLRALFDRFQRFEAPNRTPEVIAEILADVAVQRGESFNVDVRISEAVRMLIGRQAFQENRAHGYSMRKALDDVMDPLIEQQIEALGEISNRSGDRLVIEITEPHLRDFVISRYPDRAVEMGWIGPEGGNGSSNGETPVTSEGQARRLASEPSRVGANGANGSSGRLHGDAAMTLEVVQTTANDLVRGRSNGTSVTFEHNALEHLASVYHPRALELGNGTLMDQKHEVSTMLTRAINRSLANNGDGIIAPRDFTLEFRALVAVERYISDHQTDASFTRLWEANPSLAGPEALRNSFVDAVYEEIASNGSSRLTTERSSAILSDHVQALGRNGSGIATVMAAPTPERSVEDQLRVRETHIDQMIRDSVEGYGSLQQEARLAINESIPQLRADIMGAWRRQTALRRGLGETDLIPRDFVCTIMESRRSSHTWMETHLPRDRPRDDRPRRR